MDVDRAIICLRKNKQINQCDIVKSRASPAVDGRVLSPQIPLTRSERPHAVKPVPPPSSALVLQGSRSRVQEKNVSHMTSGQRVSWPRRVSGNQPQHARC